MGFKNLIVVTVPFNQFSSVRAEDITNSALDIEKPEKEDVESYCQSLFTKAFNLDNSSICDFLEHHCSLVQDPMLWINKFEKLLSENEHLFVSAGKSCKLIKYQTCSEFKRNELKHKRAAENILKPAQKDINAISEVRHFSFKETKVKTYSFTKIEQQIYFLTSEIHDYRTEDIDMINNKLPPFDTECEKLIGKIQTLSKMRAEMMENCDAEFCSDFPARKIKVNCNINQLTDIFFQLMHELFVDGKPFIDGAKADVVNLICNNFIDKESREISPATVETILRPSKDDKRPKPHKRIDLDKII